MRAAFLVAGFVVCFASSHAADGFEAGRGTARGEASSSVAADPLSECDVSWTEPGRDSQDSMPLGNGDIGLNVWTEASGDVLFYVSKTDAWSEANNTQLVKLARVRVSMTPNPFAGAGDFRQTLHLRTGEIEITGGGARLRLWVDANSPAVRAEVSSGKPVALSVSLEPWRTEAKDKVTADVVIPGETDAITWYHRNATAGVAPQLAGRTFGGTIFGAGLKRESLRSLVSAAPAEDHRFTLVACTTESGTLESWRATLDSLVSRVRSEDPVEAWKAHTAWWDGFWDRSYIRVSGDADAAAVTRGYALQRFITACAGRGAYPVKFNGSIFVTDFPGKTVKDKATGQMVSAPMDADERDWGGQYWFQNTRPMYWPRLSAGDFDIMLPLFRMYRDMLPLNSSRVREFYGHDGAYFRETAPFWGDLGKISPEDKGSYTQHYYLPVFELSTMMMDYFDYTQDWSFARDFLIPVASAGLTFYDQHFSRGQDGNLRLEPVNSIEMFWKVADPAPDIAALHFLLPRLLALPGPLVSDESRRQWQRLLGELPPVPVGEKNGRKVLLPYAGEQSAPSHNSEVPELYSVYPFRLHGAGKPDLDLARATFEERAVKRTKCWHQDPVWAAYLGLADDARRDTVKNLTNRDPRLRFPAFWEKGHDFAPDQDNGGNGELALQRMLMQADGREIRLLPAWPAGWNAEFKLHAPLNTTLEGRVENGRVSNLKVTPESRRADVVLPAT